MTSRRIVGAAVVVAVVTGACGGDADPGVVETIPPAETTAPADDTAPPDSDGTTPPPTGEATTAPPAGADTTTPPDTGDDGPRTIVDDGGRVGHNGPAILRADVPRMVIEIDRQEGVGPDEAAVDHLVSVLRRHVDKPDGIVLDGGNVFASDREQWSPDDVRAIADANRSTASGDATVSVYLVYLRGELSDGGDDGGEDEGEAIGAAVNASEVALFPDQWSGLGSLVGSDRAVERAVLVHELGHLVGLVNLTYQSDIDHEDPEHPGHSSNRDSVMHWAVETDLVGQVFSGPPPDTFDDADVADIEKIRSEPVITG